MHVQVSSEILISGIKIGLILAFFFFFFNLAVLILAFFVVFKFY